MSNSRNFNNNIYSQSDLVDDNVYDEQPYEYSEEQKNLDDLEYERRLRKQNYLGEIDQNQSNRSGFRRHRRTTGYNALHPKESRRYRMLVNLPADIKNSKVRIDDILNQLASGQKSDGYNLTTIDMINLYKQFNTESEQLKETLARLINAQTSVY